MASFGVISSSFRLTTEGCYSLNSDDNQEKGRGLLHFPLPFVGIGFSIICIFSSINNRLKGRALCNERIEGLLKPL